MENSSNGKLLQESLTHKWKNVWEYIDDNERNKIFEINEEYKSFLDRGKTEREAVKEIIRIATENGYVSLDEIIEKGIKSTPGMKIYANNKDKSIVLFVIGKEKLEKGMNIVGSHLDSPRLDLKQFPLYEDESLALLKTHYYGGIKKYQWVTLPLALHGVVINEKGEKIDVVIGEDEEDPVFFIKDLLPGKSRDVGLDRSMVAGYGQDDRVCAFTSLRAILDVESPNKTAVALFVDKEEIGSVGNTSMESKFFEYAVSELINLTEDNYSELILKRALANSSVLSADTVGAFDPNYPEVMDKRNSPYLGKGIVLVKYTGARGKSGCNDANSEYIAKIRRIFNDNKVIWQMGELGKVDQGGGGTIAYILANYGMEVVDCGVSLLSCHAPYEISSKADVYMAYKGYKAFYNA